MQISEIPLEGTNGFLLSDGPSTSEVFSTWWRPRTIGSQTQATHFLGDLVPGSVMMTDWMVCVREPTHRDQITNLTCQVDQLSFFIRQMGRDPVEAYTCDPTRLGSGSTTDPGAADIPEGGAPPFYCPDLNFDPGLRVRRIWRE